MKNKYLVITLVLLAIVLGTYLAFYFFKSNPSTKSNDEIKQMFACSRITADVRATDIYCSSPGLYREDAKNNKVIRPGDFNRLQ